MNDESAAEALAALGNVQRLKIFRQLMAVLPGGLPAGSISHAIGLPPSSLSFHLRHLVHAGLLTSQRESRNIVYSVDLQGIRSLMEFLTRDCCGGRRDACGDLGALLCGAEG
jgi:DNA-binding transcriptional ArsR family regulator